MFDGGRDKAQIEEHAYQAEENRLKDVQMRQIEEQIRITWAALEFTKQRRIFLNMKRQAVIQLPIIKNSST